MTSDIIKYNGSHYLLDSHVLVNTIREYEYDNLLISTFEAKLEKETTLKIEVYAGKLRFVYERWDRWDNKVDRAKSLPISYLMDIHRTDLYVGVRRKCIETIKDIVNDSIIQDDKIESILYKRCYLHGNIDESYYETYEHLRYNLSNILSLIFD